MAVPLFLFSERFFKKENPLVRWFGVSMLVVATLAITAFIRGNAQVWLILNDDVNCGKHFADRYTGFHKLAEVLSVMTEDDYLHRYHDVRNLASDFRK